MIIDALTRDLLILLTVVSLLGAVIGASLWSVLSSRRQKSESMYSAGQESSGAVSTEGPVVLSPADQKAIIELDGAGISGDPAVPVLNKRVDANSTTSAIHRVAQGSASMAAIFGVEQPHPTDLRDELADHLESELEVPALTESELPELVDELVFELDEREESGTASGG